MLFLSDLFMPPSFAEWACGVSLLLPAPSSLSAEARGAKVRDVVKLGSGRRRGAAAALTGDASLEEDAMLSARTLTDVGEVAADSLLRPLDHPPAPPPPPDGATAEAGVVLLARLPTVAAESSIEDAGIGGEERSDMAVTACSAAGRHFSPLHKSGKHSTERSLLCSAWLSNLRSIRGCSSTPS